MFSEKDFTLLVLGAGIEPAITIPRGNTTPRAF